MMNINHILPYILFWVALSSKGLAQIKTVSDDKDWTKQEIALSNTSEAGCIIRMGDVDNLGFGWPEDFDPFCGRLSTAHAYPWDAHEEDRPGFDRILLSSKFKPGREHPCGSDGYSIAFHEQLSEPVVYSIPTTAARGLELKNVWIQIFIDDFQAPTLCSKFQITLNGSRFAEGEKILNAIDQTGPVGKLISLPLPEEFYTAVASGNALQLKIDEVSGAADGFAIDFIRLLINRKRENTCKGNVRGKVLEKGTEAPIPNAKVLTSEKNSATTDVRGEFYLRDIPTGFEGLVATASGYSDGTGMADIGLGDDNPEVIIYLEKGKTKVDFNNQKIAVGESVNLNNILFDAAKAELKPASVAELEKVIVFMKQYSNSEIELSGHTSSEGEAGYNRSLSYKRVKACKDYIVSKGIDAGRIIAIGYGPDKPIASNDTEANRAKNRRVEMRVMKL